MRTHARKQWKRAVVELHHHALQCFLRFLIRDFQQLQNHRLVFAQHFAGRDTKHQAVADLTSGTGDCNAHGFFHWETPK